MTLMRSPRALPTLIGSVVAVASVGLVIAGRSAALSPPPSLPAIVVCIALLLVGVNFHVRIRLGAELVELTWSEAAMILAFALAPASWVILFTAFAVSASLIFRRFAFVKTVYNVASCTCAAAAAALVLRSVDIARPFSGVELGVLPAAGVVAGVVTYLAVAAVVAVVQDVPLLATWRAAAGLQVLTLAGNLGVAVGVLFLLDRYGPLAATLVPVLALSLHQANEGRLRGRQERDAGQRHAAAVGRLTEDLDEPGVLRRAAADACDLADVHFVDIELPAHGEIPALLHRHASRGEAWTGEPVDAPPVPARVVAEIPVPTDDGRPNGRLRAWLIGAGPELRLGQSQENALRSLAEHAGAAVRNARLHAQQTYYATHDRLTGLPARPLLVENVEAPFRALIHRASSDTWEPVALLIVSVTGYEEITRTLGHDLAENLLVRTARRLEAAADSHEYVSHVDAANFGIFLPYALDPAHVRSRALKLLEALTSPFQLDTTDIARDLPTTQVTLDATCGAAFCLHPIGSGNELLRQANVALKQARAVNVRFDIYDPGVDELGGPAAVVLTSELHAALADHQLDLHYQPIIHLPSGAPVGMEALLRWHHPTKGLLYAGQFMTVLERSPDHGRFVAWQLELALRTRRDWGDRDLPISINLAARCLLDRRFPDQVADALDRHGVSGDQLMFEIDETAVLTQLGLVGDVLTQLRLLGVRVAIDSLGTGTSSMFGLLKVPATHVKVDGRLVRKMLIDPEAAAVVGLGLDLGRRADLQFVATGVNSEELLDALQQRGCDTAQGPVLVRPMLADEVPGYLATAPISPTIPIDAIVSLDSRRRTPTP